MKSVQSCVGLDAPFWGRTTWLFVGVAYPQGNIFHECGVADWLADPILESSGHRERGELEERREIKA